MSYLYFFENIEIYTYPYRWKHNLSNEANFYGPGLENIKTHLYEILNISVLNIKHIMNSTYGHIL